MTVPVAVIIAHDKNRDASMLGRCVESVKSEGVTDIRVVTEGNKSEARNSGALASDDENFIYIFLDDDVQLRPGCVKELLAPFEDEKVGLVGGVNIAFSDISFEEQIGASLLSSPLAMFRSAARYTPRGDVRESDEAEIVGCVMAIRKEAFDRVRGFPTDCIPNEENVLIMKLKMLDYKVIYNPFAVCYHRRPKVFWEYAKALFGYGKGRGIMIRKMGTHGAPKMLWVPNKKWLYYVAGMVVHYASYVSGVLWGLINGGRVSEKKAPESTDSPA